MFPAVAVIDPHAAVAADAALFVADCTAVPVVEIPRNDPAPMMLSPVFCHVTVSDVPDERPDGAYARKITTWMPPDRRYASSVHVRPPVPVTLRVCAPL